MYEILVKSWWVKLWPKVSGVHCYGLKKSDFLEVRKEYFCWQCFFRVCFPKSLEGGSGSCGVKLFADSGELWCELTCRCSPGRGDPKVQSCKVKVPFNSIHDDWGPGNGAWNEGLETGRICFVFREDIFNPIALNLEQQLESLMCLSEPLCIQMGISWLFLHACCFAVSTVRCNFFLSPELGCVRLKKSVLMLSPTYFQKPFRCFSPHKLGS